MLAKRIIPCLDIRDGRTVKGICFEDLRDAGEPAELAEKYCIEGADELVLLDITATNDQRKTRLGLVQKVAQKCNIPFTVGGGISSTEDVYGLLSAGADKISVNSAAFLNPELVPTLAKNFGSQCIVVAIDAHFEDGDWLVYLNGGRKKTGVRALDYAKRVYHDGAGEILLTAMNNDGTKSGFACEITRAISNSVNIPVIASGGAGSIKHFEDVFKTGAADAALAASVFHYGEIKIKDLKTALKNTGIKIRQ